MEFISGDPSAVDGKRFSALTYPYSHPFLCPYPHTRLQSDAHPNPHPICIPICNC